MPRNPKIDPSKIYPTAKPPSARLGKSYDDTFTQVESKHKFSWRTIKRLLIYLLVLICVVTFFSRTDSRGVTDIDPQILQEPIQTPTSQAQFTHRVGSSEYLIKPRFNYELKALVVSKRDYDRLPDAKERDGYMLFQADLCVLWGKNVTSGVYRELSFFANSEANDSARWCKLGSFFLNKPLLNEQLSNNHLLFANPELRTKLDEVKRGDQVKIVGKLVDAQEIVGPHPGMSWRTSTSRTDTLKEDGAACESILVEDVVILAKNKNISQHIFILSAVLLGGLFIGNITARVIHSRRAKNAKRIR